MMRLMLSTLVALILTSGATSADAQVKCPTMVAPIMPKAAIDSKVEGQVKARARIKDGAVIDVFIISGPRIFFDAVREAMMQYKCDSASTEAFATQVFNFHIDGNAKTPPPAQTEYAMPAVAITSAASGLMAVGSSGSRTAQREASDLALAKALADIKQEKQPEAPRRQQMVNTVPVAALTASMTTVPARGEEQETFTTIKTHASEGDTSAQIQLGDMYASGQGVKKSQPESIKWYRMAAEAGNLEAQLNLASIYEQGSGVKKDQLQASRWYQLAAENGSDVAQYKVGEMYSKGLGVRKNSDEAEKWFRLAAGHGNVNAQVILGNIYSTGQGVRQDYSEAAVWYRQAALQGNLQAQYALGSLYRTGRGVAKDPSEAVSWFQMAAARGDNKSQVAINSLRADVARQQLEQEQLREQERQRQQAIKQEQEQLREQVRQRELARKREQERDQEQQQRYQRQEELLRRQTELMERQAQQQQQERERAAIEKQKCLENATERLCRIGCIGARGNDVYTCPQRCAERERANVAACNGVFLPPAQEQIIIQQAPMQMPNPAACIQDGGSTMCLRR